MRRLVALIAFATTLAGCGGGGQSNSSQVVSVTHRYFAAVASGNGAEACSLLSGQAKERLLRNAPAFSVFTHQNRLLSCPEEIKVAHDFLGPEALAAYSKAAVTVQAISGSSATARAVLGSRTTSVPLSKTSHGWLIDRVSVLTPRPAPYSEGNVALERQLAAGEVHAATVNKRARTVHLTLSNGSHVLLRYGARQEPKVAAELTASGVPVTIMTPAEAERDAATLRGE